MVRGYTFSVPTRTVGGVPAPRTRVHGEDLDVEQIKRRETVAQPFAIERLHVYKAL